MNPNLKELIKKLVQEYTGTGDAASTGLTSDDGNNATSQRSRFHDPHGADEMEFYLNQNKGKGGDGGHYTNEPVNPSYNRHRFVRFEELENYIKKMLEEMEVEEQAYGSATLTTQGPPRSGAVAATSEYPYSITTKSKTPGIQEQTGQDPKIADIQKKIQDNNKENANFQLDITQIGIDTAVSNQNTQSSEQAKQIQDIEMQIADLNNQENQIIDFIKQAAAELNQNFPADLIDYTPEDITRKETLETEVAQWREQITQIKQKIKDLSQTKSSQISTNSTAKSSAAANITQQRKAFRQQKQQMKKQLKQQQQSQLSELLHNYISNRKDKNLMEYIDSYKREILMEKAISKFFKFFDDGKTDEEILRLYAEQGIVVPEPFVKKARDKHKKYKHEKLDLEELEQETKEFKKAPSKTEDEIEINVKELSSRLFKEGEVKDRYQIPSEIKNTLEKELKMYPLMRFIKNFKAVNSTTPTYRVFLLNGNFFDIKYKEIRPGKYGLMAKMGIDEYDLYDY